MDPEVVAGHTAPSAPTAVVHLAHLHNTQHSDLGTLDCVGTLANERASLAEPFVAEGVCELGFCGGRSL